MSSKNVSLKLQFRKKKKVEKININIYRRLLASTLIKKMSLFSVIKKKERKTAMLLPYVFYILLLLLSNSNSK